MALPRATQRYRFIPASHVSPQRTVSGGCGWIGRSYQPGGRLEEWTPQGKLHSPYATEFRTIRLNNQHLGTKTRLLGGLARLKHVVLFPTGARRAFRVAPE